ncbi:MAG: hypothetical protein AAFR76_05860 [Planctomycetota bacterium]
MRIPSSLGFRPTFVLRSPLEEHELAAQLERRLGNRARSAGPHLLISLPTESRKPWSPWLHVDIRSGDEPDGGSDLVCRFSPHPSMWTGVMLAELALLTTVFFATFFAVGQQVAKQPAWAWWLAIGAAVLAVALWVGAQLGQHLARDEMRSFYDEIAAISNAQHVFDGRF